MKTPTARKLPSGHWNVRVQVKGEVLSVTADSKKEAEKKALLLKMGESAPKSGTTLRDAATAYIDSRRNICSPATIRGYVEIRDHRFQDIMDKDVYSLTRQECQMAADNARKHYAGKTVVNSWRFISSVIEYTTRKRIRVELPQIVLNEKQWLRINQISMFLDAVKGTSVEIPALLALSSLRCSEFLDLKWSDIDLSKNILKVRGSAVPDEQNNLVHKAENKNTGSRRTVVLIPQLREALEAKQRSGDYVVTMTANGIYKGINRVCRNAGLPLVGIHGLRHSFASLAKHLGLDEMTAMRLGGWSDTKTMHKIYTHLAEDDINNSAQLFLNFFQKLE